MIDQKVNMFIAKHCAPTSSVQVWDPTTTATYIGAGEMVITDTTGKVLSTSSDPGKVLSTSSDPGKVLSTSSDPSKDTQIQIYQRSFDGEKIYKSQPFCAKDIVDYRAHLFCQYYPQEVLVVNIPVYNSYTYVLKIRRVGTHSEDQFPRWKSVVYKSDATATIAEINTGLANAINSTFANDIVFPITATATGTSTQVLRITASTQAKYKPGLFPWSPFHFDVEFGGYLAGAFTPTTVRDTRTWSGTETGVTISNKAYIGQGTYQVTADMEWDTKLELYHGKARSFNQPFITPDITLDTEKYLADGVTGMQYDYVTINLEKKDGTLSENIKHKNSIVLALPVEDNSSGSYQVAGLIATLNDIIVTNWGIGTAISLT